MRSPRIAAAGAILSAAAGASAQTIIAGGNLPSATWTVGGSPFVITGDVTIPAGNVLTLQPGVTVLVAGTDGLGAGLDPTRVEIIVQGALLCLGSTAAPVTFRAQSGTGSALWYGIRIASGSTGASITDASIQNTVTALMMAAGSVGLHHVSVSDFRDHGLVLAGGSLAADRCTFIGGASGVNVTGGGGTVSNGYFSGQAAGVLANAAAFSNVVTCSHCTFDRCGSGVSVGAGNGAVNIRNSIIAHSQNYGVFRPIDGTVQVSVLSTDVYSDTGPGNFAPGLSPGSGCIFLDPLLASPTDPHLLPGSPCINAAAPAYCTSSDLFGTPRPQGPACDMGAAEVPFVCYPNCDNSTAAPILNVQDFSCFLQKFASQDAYANCDASTAAPTLNVQDFSCFLQKFAAGCN